MQVMLKPRLSPSKRYSRLIPSNRSKITTGQDNPKTGQTRLDCLETAARVIEIHYPELPLSKDLRNIVNEMARIETFANRNPKRLR